MKQRGVTIRARKSRTPWWEDTNNPVVRDRINRLRMTKGLRPLAKPKQRQREF